MELRSGVGLAGGAFYHRAGPTLASLQLAILITAIGVRPGFGRSVPAADTITVEATPFSGLARHPLPGAHRCSIEAASERCARETCRRDCTHDERK
jgi:hypothetical protein